MKLEPKESVIETIQKLMDDPNYIPTGPTYGELMEGLVGGCYRCAEQGHPCHISYHRTWDEAQAMERERCARIAENWIEHSGEYGMAGFIAEIAAAIRSGE